MEIDAAIERLAGERETPFFLFSEEILGAEIDRFQEAFFSDFPVRFYYSIKTNRERAILARLAAKKLGAAVATAWELELAREAGFDPARSCLDGPWHSEDEFARALDMGLGFAFLDGAEELARIEAAARRTGRRARVGFRLATEGGALETGPAEMAHGRFGIEAEKVPDLARRAASGGALEVAALSVHVGSQVTNPRLWLRALATLEGVATRLEKEGVCLDEVNLGGGFPSRTLKKNTLLDLAFAGRVEPRFEGPDPVPRIGQEIVASFRRLRERLARPPSLGLAPGRALVSRSGVLAARVRAVKDKWVVVDASRDFLPESLVFSTRQIRILGRSGEESVNVAGASLNSGDVLALGRKLGPLAVGDLVILEDAGAYSLSRTSRLTTLSPPAFLLKKDGEIVAIRREETIEDLRAPVVGG